MKIILSLTLYVYYEHLFKIFFFFIKRYCFCSSSFGTYGMAAQNSMCSTRCPGQYSQMCGRTSLPLNSVYATSLGIKKNIYLSRFIIFILLKS